MADKKRYYWIKLKTDFFNQETMDFLMAQENGCQYIVLYQMLCLQSANNHGELATRIGEVIVPYDIKKIVRDTKYFDFDTVTVALELFTKLGLIYQQEDQVLRISNFDEMVGSETTWAEKKRAYRQKIKQIEDKAEDNDLDNTEDNSRTMSEKRLDIRDKRLDIRDKRLEKEKEREIERASATARPARHKYGEYKNVLLSDNELEKIKQEYPDWEKRIETLSGYIASTGKTYKSHYATIRNWARRDQEKQKKEPVNQTAQDLTQSYEMMARWAEK
jgi:predicted phage replisome organizer